MNACNDKILLIQAHLDGELDAANALALEAHLKTCPACAGEVGRMEAVREMLAGAALGPVAPASLHGRIEAMIAAEAAGKAASKRRARPRLEAWRPRIPGGSRLGWAGMGALSIGRSWGGGLVTGLALSLALVLAVPQFTRLNTEDQLVANHIRSLSIANHLTDIATSNRHVVKPWFNGKIDFAPPVPELASEGFPLVGGRLDYVDGHEVAAIVYKRRLHTINVFVQPAAALSLPSGISMRHDGYSLMRWTNGGLEFWAVSDIDAGELQLFQRAFVGQPSL